MAHFRAAGHHGPSQLFLFSFCISLDAPRYGKMWKPLCSFRTFCIFPIKLSSSCLFQHSCQGVLLFNECVQPSPDLHPHPCSLLLWIMHPPLMELEDSFSSRILEMRHSPTETQLLYLLWHFDIGPPGAIFIVFGGIEMSTQMF